jgi:hypothetical protein
LYITANATLDVKYNGTEPSYLMAKAGPKVHVATNCFATNALKGWDRSGTALAIPLG